MLYGIEKDYLNAVIRALIEANRTMHDTLVEEAVSTSHVRHKGDTLGLDQRPENTISDKLLTFDQYAILITEERGADTNPLTKEGPTTVRGARTFYGCDPCDRSSELRKFLQSNAKQHTHVSGILRKRNVTALWEKEFGKPASITGANAAITCIRRGIPICSVILNYITQQLTIACCAGIFRTRLPRNSNTVVDFDFMSNKGTPLRFPQPGSAHSKRVVTFVGKPERGYPENFFRSKMVMEHDLEKSLHYPKPGGPTRILYLSDLQPRSKPVGFIMANGEKFGEWVHWLPFVLTAKQDRDASANALRVFEVSQDHSLMRDGYLMMPTQTYSAFQDVGDGRVIVNVDFLRGLDNPSKYRATLIVSPANNAWAMSRVEQYGYREIKF
jgi:hypothetical protein